MLDNVFGSLLVVRVDVIFDFTAGFAFTVFVTFIRGVASPFFFDVFGESLHVILSLKYFILFLSAPVPVVKHVSCLLKLEDVFERIFIVEMSLKVELFREDLLFGGDGGDGGFAEIEEGAVLL